MSKLPQLAQDEYDREHPTGVVPGVTPNQGAGPATTDTIVKVWVPGDSYNSEGEAQWDEANPKPDLLTRFLVWMSGSDDPSLLHNVDTRFDVPDPAHGGLTGREWVHRFDSKPTPVGWNMSHHIAPPNSYGNIGLF